MTPTIGRVVHYFPGENDAAGQSNGNKADDPVAAVITRVWSDVCVNLTVLLDDHPPVVRSSVLLAGSGTGSGGDNARWNWPPRV